MNEPRYCAWCMNKHNFKTELSFTIIDDDIEKYVPEILIDFCPFCGRELSRKKKKREGKA